MRKAMKSRRLKMWRGLIGRRLLSTFRTAHQVDSAERGRQLRADDRYIGTIRAAWRIESTVPTDGPNLDHWFADPPGAV